MCTRSSGAASSETCGRSRGPACAQGRTMCRATCGDFDRSCGRLIAEPRVGPSCGVSRGAAAGARRGCVSVWGATFLLALRRMGGGTCGFVRASFRLWPRCPAARPAPDGGRRPGCRSRRPDGRRPGGLAVLAGRPPTVRAKTSRRDSTASSPTLPGQGHPPPSLESPPKRRPVCGHLVGPLVGPPSIDRQVVWFSSCPHELRDQNVGLALIAPCRQEHLSSKSETGDHCERLNTFCFTNSPVVDRQS